MEGTSFSLPNQLNKLSDEVSQLRREIDRREAQKEEIDRLRREIADQRDRSERENREMYEAISEMRSELSKIKGQATTFGAVAGAVLGVVLKLIKF
jgi:uncharacterized coiled-coil DUF342 family protein